MWLVLSHQEPQTQYKSEIKEKTLSRQESLDGLRISQKSAKTPLFTEFSDGLWGGNLDICKNFTKYDYSSSLSLRGSVSRLFSSISN